MLAASAISIGWNRKSNCGTPKSNSAWNVESPSRRAPGSEIRRMNATHAGAERVLAPPASTNSTASPISVIAAPPISIRCVGPHSVTSWPNSRCQTSSSGKPISANVPAEAIRTPPSGAYQSRPSRIADALGRSFGSTIAKKPALKIPKRPTRMK